MRGTICCMVRWTGLNLLLLADTDLKLSRIPYYDRR